MLEVKCQEHLDATRAHADSIGKREQFEGKMRWLEKVRGTVVLEADTTHKPGHSFYFTIYTLAGARLSNGGLIFHVHRQEWDLHT